MDYPTTSIAEPQLEVTSDDCERALLGVILVNPTILADVTGIIEPDSFGLYANRLVYLACLELYRRNEKIDLLTVRAEMIANGDWEKLNNRGYLATLEPDHFTSWDTYAIIVREFARQRRAKKLASDLLTAADKLDRAAVQRISAELNTLANDRPGNIIQAADRFTLTKTRDVLGRPAPTWLYANEIPSNALITLTGASGNGKTHIAIDYALSIAQQHKVIYVAAERPYAALKRGVAWLDHHRKSDDNLAWIEQPVILTDKTDVQALIARAKEFGAAFIVFDTFSRCADGINEDSNSEVKRVMGALDTIRRETGATVMAVHHTGWGGARERGASAMRDYAEVAILVEKVDEVITISCNKMSNADEFEPRNMRLIAVNDTAIVIPADNVRQTPQDKLTRNQRELLKAANLAIFDPAGATRKDLQRAARISDGSIDRELSSLKKLGYLRQHEKGDPYFITDSGKSKLTPSTPSEVHHDGFDGLHNSPASGPSITITPLWGDGIDGMMVNANGKSNGNGKLSDYAACPICGSPKEYLPDGHHFCVNPDCSIGRKYASKGTAA